MLYSSKFNLVTIKGLRQMFHMDIPLIRPFYDTLADALDALKKQNGAVLDINPHFAAAAPRGRNDVAAAFFIPLPSRLDDDDFERVYRSYRLLPMSPFVLTEMNKHYPELPDIFPNCTHWRHGKRWCHSTFSKGGDGKRHIVVDSARGNYGEGWWGAGVLALP